jgi:hypothetical protein
VDKAVQFLRVFKDYRDNAPEKVVGISEQLEPLITSLNRQQLQAQGEDNQKRTIRPPYSPVTRRYKARRGQPANRVTLRDTGDFHDSIFALFEGDEITLYADDPKAPKLVAKYGRDVLGLTTDSIDILVDRLRPAVQDKFKKDLLR